MQYKIIRRINFIIGSITIILCISTIVSLVIGEYGISIPLLFLTLGMSNILIFTTMVEIN